MRYEEPPHLDHSEASAVLSEALGGSAGGLPPSSVLVGLALNDEDRAFVERWCVRIGHSAPDLALRGVAALCVGHLARRFGEVSGEAADLVRTLAADEAVRKANPHVLDAVDDLEQ